MRAIPTIFVVSILATAGAHAGTHEATTQPDGGWNVNAIEFRHPITWAKAGTWMFVGKVERTTPFGSYALIESGCDDISLVEPLYGKPPAHLKLQYYLEVPHIGPFGDFVHIWQPEATVVGATAVFVVEPASEVWKKLPDNTDDFVDLSDQSQMFPTWLGGCRDMTGAVAFVRVIKDGDNLTYDQFRWLGRMMSSRGARGEAEELVRGLGGSDDLVKEYINDRLADLRN